MHLVAEGGLAAHWNYKQSGEIKDNKKYNFYSELNKLWIHGLVHLFGFKHYKITDYKKMNVLEKKILNHINK